MVFAGLVDIPFWISQLSHTRRNMWASARYARLASGSSRVCNDHSDRNSFDWFFVFFFFFSSFCARFVVRARLWYAALAILSPPPLSLVPSELNLLRTPPFAIYRDIYFNVIVSSCAFTWFARRDEILRVGALKIWRFFFVCLFVCSNLWWLFYDMIFEFHTL